MGCTQTHSCKANHPNFPHIQSIEYATHADQPRGHVANTHWKHSKNAAEKKRKMQNMRTVSARKKEKSGRVALSGMALGDMEVNPGFSMWEVEAQKPKFPKH